jgi:simple sugar transport system permease protein
MAILQPRRFFSASNIQQLAFQIPEFGILAIGMMVAMISGGIDLSIITTANLAGITSAIVMLTLSHRGSMDLSALLKGIMADEGTRSSLQAAMPTGIAMVGIVTVTVLVSLAVGVLCGLFNGFLVAKIKITPILATLGTMKLYEGIALVITKGSPLTGFPDEFIFLGSGSVGGMPTPMIIFILAIIMLALLLRKTPLGRGIYAVGENPLAAQYSGLDNAKILMKTYAITGLMAGLAAVVMMARVDSIKVGYGNSFQLQSILVVILGGVSTIGGTGNIIGVVFSVFILRVISSGFNIMGFSNYMRNVIWGVLLIVVAIALSSGFKSLKKSRGTQTKILNKHESLEST